MAKHMTHDTRKGIAHGLSCGLTFAELAGMFHRAESTIANEVKNRMIWSNEGYGRTNAVCEHFETCSKIYRNADGRRIPFKSQRRCFEKLGVRRINAEDIVLDPILLGPKFKQEANRAILRRNGVAL